MKFEAIMNDQAAMDAFLNVSLSLKKFGKTCILRLSKKKVFFILSEEKIGPRRPSVWCELPVSFYFEEYEVVGMGKEENDIFIELSTALLAGTCSIFKQDANAVKMKITQSDVIYLTLEMELMLEQMQIRRCVHDIPVELLAEKYWGDYEEPIFNDFHVSIQMPKLKSIKNVVDNIKSLSERISVSVKKSGELTLDINTSTVKLHAGFSELSVYSFVQEHISNTDEDNVKVTATIDLKKFLNFLSGMQLMDCPAICSIAHGRLVKLFLDAPEALKLQMFLFELDT